ICYLIYFDNAHPATIFAALVVLVTSQVISYVKARGEASGFSMIGGLIERPERLILGLVGIGLEGLGVPSILPVCLWLLAIGSIFTVYQRLMQAYKQDRQENPKAPGAKTDIGRASCRERVRVWIVDDVYKERI